jgi:sugar lactone lactonase YvrE
VSILNSFLEKGGQALTKGGNEVWYFVMLKTEILLDGLGFPEAPRWHDGKLWFSDMGTRRVMTVDLGGTAETVVEVPGQPSGLGWLPDNRLLVISMKDRRLLRLDPGGLVEIADLREFASFHCNDMVVDQQGCAYIGNFGFDIEDPDAALRHAVIVLVMPDGAVRIVADEMVFPNGSVITPDGGTFIVAESFASRITAFSIEPDGSLTGRRVWAQFDDLGFVMSEERIGPDGICLDAEGAIWLASPESTEVLRVKEGGEITHRFTVETQPFAVMLGGPDRRTLFVCTTLLSERNSGRGRIEIVRVDVPGAGLP